MNKSIFGKVSNLFLHELMNILLSFNKCNIYQYIKVEFHNCPISTKFSCYNIFINDVLIMAILNQFQAVVIILIAIISNQIECKFGTIKYNKNLRFVDAYVSLC